MNTSACLKQLQRLHIAACDVGYSPHTTGIFRPSTWRQLSPLKQISPARMECINGASIYRN
eukprot:4279716-Pleurochrysis_carterae.AAC.1